MNNTKKTNDDICIALNYLLHYNHHEQFQGSIVEQAALLPSRNGARQQSSVFEQAINYVLAELEFYDLIRDQSMKMSVVDDVWQSDELIPQDIKQ
ncbi:unnamed protein product [Rotaria sp. Silwood2]|nr:unnamed protein product [Rotaria sp. Silwood2]